MENKKDFRVGDAVCSLAHGDGVIVAVSKDSRDIFPHAVSFASGRTEWYMRDGREHAADSHPTLFHGTFEQVFGQVKDVNPVRKVTKYLNIAEDGDGHRGWWIYDTKELAIKDSTPSDGFIFVAIAVPIEVEE